MTARRKQTAPPDDPGSAPDRRVLLLVDQYEDPYGGTEGQIRTLLEHLPPGWDAELWVLQGSRWLETHAFPVRAKSLHLTNLARPHAVLRLLALAGTVRRARFDLVHTWMNDASLVGPLLARRAGIPVVVSRRDLGFWQTPRSRAVLRRTGRLASGVLANCDAVASHTSRTEHLPPGRVVVVANGQDPARFEVEPEQGLRARLGIPPDAPLVGLVANVKPLKRHDDLLDALAALGEESVAAVEERADVHALLIGEPVGGAEPPLEERIHRRDLEERVHVVHAPGNVVPLLRHLDVGVLCSETEGLSNAILEYLGVGLPVVATAVGGNVDLVEAEENGLLYAPGDVPALTGHLRRLLGDAALRRRLGAASRRRFEASYTLPRMVRETAAAWETALAGGSRGPRLRWQVVEAPEALEALAPAWRARLGPDAWFAGPDWVLAWLAEAPSRVKACVLAGRDEGGRLCGVLPLVRRGVDLAFAGEGLGADHLDVVADRENALDVARSALAFLEGQPWRRLRLHHLAEDGALRLALHERRWQLPFRESLATTCSYVGTDDEGDGTYDAFVAGRFSKASRRNIRRYPRRFRALDGAHVERIEEPAAAAAAVDRYYALHGARVRQRGVRSTMDGDGAHRFHRRLATRAAESGALAMTFLRLGARDIACEYAFRHEDKMYAFQSGFDPSAPVESPGLVLQAIVMEEDVFGRGLAEYDFLDGQEDYKRRWATGERRLFDLIVHRPTARGRLACLALGAPYVARDLLLGRG